MGLATIRDTFSLEGLTSIYRILQVPIVSILVFLFFKAIYILKKSELFYVGLALSFNLVYLIFGILSDQNFKIFKSISPKSISVFSMISSINDILCTASFTLALASWYHYTKNGNPGPGMILKLRKTFHNSKRTFVLLMIFGVFFAFVLCVGIYTGFEMKNVLQRTVASLYDFLGLALIVYVFRDISQKSRFKYFIIVGFGIWGVLQLSPLLDYPDNEPWISIIGYSISLVAKISILIGIFLWYIFVAKQLDLDREKLNTAAVTAVFYNDLLSSTFHDIILPLRTLDQLVSDGDSMNVLKFHPKRDDAITSLERIKGIIYNSISHYNNKLSTGDHFEMQILSSSQSIMSINTVLEQAVKTIKANYKEVNFIFNYAPNCYVTCDPTQLARIFDNLIKNSIESYQKNERRDVTIKSYVSKSKENDLKKVIVEIEDKGSGILKEIQPLVWEMGYSTKDKEQTKFSRGNGLATVKAIIESHTGAEITLESPVMQKNTDGSFKAVKGTKFIISMDKKELPLIKK